MGILKLIKNLFKSPDDYTFNDRVYDVPDNKNSVDNTNYSNQDPHIRNFKWITYKGESFSPNMVCNESYLKNVDPRIRKDYSSKTPTGVKWTCNDREIFFFEENTDIEGLPFPDMKKALISKYNFNLDKKIVAIYNEDGTVFKELAEFPMAISDLAKELYCCPVRGYHFGQIVWKKNSKGNIVCGIHIDLDPYFFEVREVDENTGDFGEVLGSGRD